MNGLKMKYFVLKPKGQDLYAFASRMALRKYAQIISDIDPQLAADLNKWISVCTSPELIDNDSSMRELYDL